MRLLVRHGEMSILDWQYTNRTVVRAIVWWRQFETLDQTFSSETASMMQSRVSTEATAWICHKNGIDAWRARALTQWLRMQLWVVTVADLHPPSFYLLHMRFFLAFSWIANASAVRVVCSRCADSNWVSIHKVGGMSKRTFLSWHSACIETIWLKR